MVAVITGDIIDSRKLINQDVWLIPLKKLLANWGETPKYWKIDRGDFFQLELANAEDALEKALQIKALIKKVEPKDKRKKDSIIDVRLAIGIGEKTFVGESISESNGPAFIYSAESFDELNKEDLTLGLKSQWSDFDEEMNLYLKLACIFMDDWSILSAELVDFVFKNPNMTQKEIGKVLGVQQSAISRRWNRAHGSDMLEVERMFRKKINLLMQC